jgi:hypothetical protein
MGQCFCEISVEGLQLPQRRKNNKKKQNKHKNSRLHDEKFTI